MNDQFPSPSFPVEGSRDSNRDIQSVASQLSPRNPIDIPYSTSLFETRSGMVLTVLPTNYFTGWYIRETENLFCIGLAVSLATLSGVMNSEVYFQIPEGRRALGFDVVAGHGGDGGGFFALRVDSARNSRQILMRKETLGNYVAGSFYCAFQIRVRLLPVAV
jgi:hypothetical protein